MSGWIGKPFFWSAAVTLSLTFPCLWMNEKRPTRAEVRVGAFVDPHVDVAHQGTALEASLRFSLQWLKRHQHPQGVWSARSFGQMCEGEGCAGGGADEHDVGTTALAVLAELEAGALRSRYEDSARKGLEWLEAQQGLDGCFGPSSGKFIYGHALATLAFARACTLLNAEEFRGPAARGARFLKQARNPGYAWRYGIRDGENDMSVTSWATSALLACAAPEVGVPVEPRVSEGIQRALAQATCDWTHETSYPRSGEPGADPRFERNEGLSGAAVWLRLCSGVDPSASEVRGAARRLGWSLPCWNESGTTVDYVAWYSGTRALAAYGDPGLWGPWSGNVRRVLVSHQRKYQDGCSCGSWDPVDRWGRDGGRVYATALNALTLEILQKHPSP